MLEAIGVITKAESKKASSRSGDSYQETVAVPLSREHDIDGEAEEAEEEEGSEGTPLKAVQKVRKSESLFCTSSNDTYSFGALSRSSEVARSADKNGSGRLRSHPRSWTTSSGGLR